MSAHMAQGAPESDESEQEDQEEDDEEQRADMPWDSENEFDIDNGMTQFEATISLATCIIGAGIMALPQLPKKGGWLLCALGMICCCAAMGEAGNAMWKGFMAYNYNRKDSEKIVSYEDFGRTAAGRKGELIIALFVVIYFVGCLGGYTILIAQQLVEMFDEKLSQQTWTLILTPFLLALSMLRNMTAIAKLVPIGIAGAFGSCILIILKALIDARNWQSWPEADQDSIHRKWPVSFMSFGSVVAVLFGAFGVNANVPSVLSEMKDPLKFPMAFKTALVMVLILYLFIMLLGYYGYGNFVHSNILVSMSYAPANATEASQEDYHNWTGNRTTLFATIMQICVLTNLIISFPLNLMAIINTVQTIEPLAHMVPVGSPANYLMRAILTLMIVGLALSIPDFGIIFELVCSICSPFIQIILPICFAYRIRKTVAYQRSSWVRRFFHACIMVLAAFTLIIGFSNSLQDFLASQTS